MISTSHAYTLKAKQLCDSKNPFICTSGALARANFFNLETRPLKSFAIKSVLELAQFCSGVFTLKIKKWSIFRKMYKIFIIVKIPKRKIRIDQIWTVQNPVSSPI